MFGNKFGCHNNVECGLVCILPNKEEWQPIRTAPIPLKSVSILASVVHAVAQVELTQVFVNVEEQPIEAIYYFPVDSNGGITHFQAELEGRTIKGVVKAQEDAKADYDKAVAEKQTAFLVESNKPDIFKVRIGFLKPGTQVKVVIGYVTEVKNEKGSNAMRFFIPTTVAPRYIPPTESDPKSLDLQNMKFSKSSPAPLSIRVNVSIQGAIKSVESVTHQISIVEKAAIPEKPHWTRAVVELNGKTTDMDRDFVLLVTPEDVHLPRLYSEKFEGKSALMSHLIPSFNLDDQKVELIFVLDRSGSMQGQSIDLAKKALSLFLHSIPVDCYFNVVGFGSTYEYLFPESTRYDDDSLKKALVQAESLQADLGGTEIFDPLKTTYEKKRIPGYLRQIFVLTDGEVSNTDQVIGLVKAHSNIGRLFALGIGDSSSHHLVEGLAEAGGGTACFVTYKEKIDSKVLQQLKNAIQPSLMDISVNWTGISGGPASAEVPVVINKEKTLLGYGKPVKQDNTGETSKPVYRQVPELIPPVYDGSQLLVFGLFTTEVASGLTITAQSPDGPLSLEVKVDEKNDLGSIGMIHKLAAIKLVRELEMKVAALAHGTDSTNLKEAEESLKKEIIAISLENGVGSKYTSFVAIDETEGKAANENWVMQTRYVPSQFAHGWHGGFSNAMRSPRSMAFCSGVQFTSTGNYPNITQQMSNAYSFSGNPPSRSNVFSFSTNPTNFSQPISSSTFGLVGNLNNAPFGKQNQMFSFSPNPANVQNMSNNTFGFGGNPVNVPQNMNAFSFPGNTNSLKNNALNSPQNIKSVPPANSLFGQSEGATSQIKNSFSYSGNANMPLNCNNTFGFGCSGPAAINVPQMKACKKKRRSAPAPPAVTPINVKACSRVVSQTFRDAEEEELDEQMDCALTFEEEKEEHHTPAEKQQSDQLYALVGIQSFDGSFPLNEAFAAAVKFSLKNLEKEAKAKGWDVSAYATAFAIAYFEQKLADSKDSWDLVVLKARKWLKKNFADLQSAMIHSATSTVINEGK